MDPLADVLARAGAHGALFAHSRLCGPWGLTMPGDRPLSFHAVLDGEVTVTAPGHAPFRLGAGDLLLMRGGQPYRLTHAPGAPTLGFADFRARAAVPEQPGRYELAGPGEPTVLLCGSYTFTTTAADSLLRQLPELMAVRAETNANPALPAALRLLADEVGRTGTGQQTALDRLLDLMLLYGLRAWLEQPEVTKPVWFQALDDVEIGVALRLLHAEPARPWTLESLAAAVGLSRSAFARRFAELAGEPPLTYLSRWRMTLAEEALRRPGATLATVADEVGYRSEFAFAAAFKRQYGIAPGRWRRSEQPVRP